MTFTYTENQKSLHQLRVHDAPLSKFDFSIADSTLDDDITSIFSKTDLNILLESDQTKRILILEHDPLHMDQLEEFILHINPDAHIDWETDAQRAIDIISSSETIDDLPYEIVISDIKQEVRPGSTKLIEFCKRSKPKLKTILISDKPKEKLDLNVRVKAHEYLQRPLSFNSFKKKLKPLLTV